MPAALVLQSHDDRPAGLLDAWAPARGIELDVIRVDRWRTLPDPSDYLFAVALAAGVSVEGDWPAWAATELEWLRLADAVGVPVLGIGFGAQLLGVALGGTVRAVAGGETAWTTVATRDPARVPSGPWLVPCNDAISAPANAEALADGRDGPLAFAVDRHLCLHFHPEVTPALLARWSRAPRERPAADRAALLTEARASGERSRDAAFALFDAFAARAGLAVERDRRPVHAAVRAGAHARRRLVFAPYRDASIH